MKAVIYRGADIPVEIGLYDDADAPLLLSSLASLVIELIVKGRIVGTYSVAAGTIVEGSATNMALFRINTTQSILYPYGMVQAHITAGYTDAGFADGIRHEVTVIDLAPVA